MRHVILVFWLSIIGSSALAAQCDSEPDEISVLLGSHHANASFDYNEFNYGVFLNWGCHRLKYSTGAYLNSFQDLAVAGFASFRLLDFTNGSVSAFTGAAYFPDISEADFNYNIVPMGGLRINIDPFFINVMPGYKQNFDYLISVGVTIVLDDWQR